MDGDYGLMFLLVEALLRLSMLVRARRLGMPKAARTAAEVLAALPPGSEVRWVGPDGDVWIARSSATPSGKEQTT